MDGQFVQGRILALVSKRYRHAVEFVTTFGLRRTRALRTAHRAALSL